MNAENSPSYCDKAGKFLTATDIMRMDEKIFMPAIVRCSERGAYDHEEGWYYMNLPEPVSIREGIAYYSRFYSEMDSKTGVCRHYVSQDSIEECTFNQLTNDERQLVRSQFFQQYLDEGGNEESLYDDTEWQALLASDKYDDVAITYNKTVMYLFADTMAIRNHYITRTLVVRGENPRVLGEYSFEHRPDPEANYDPTAVLMVGFSPEETAMIDLAHEDFSAVTTTDLPEVMEIMTSLGLVTWQDQKQYAQGV